MSVREILNNNQYMMNGQSMTLEGDLTVKGRINAQNDLSISGDVIIDTLTVNSTLNATSSSTGAFTVAGGMGIGKDLFVVGTLTCDTIQYNQIDTVQSTNESTSITTGALTVAGGLGIVKRINVGGDASFQSTTQSTSSDTGSVLVSGGLGIAKNLYVGGTINGSFTTPTTDSTTTSSGGFIVSGGLSVAKKINSGSTITAPKMVINGSASSTDAITGDLTVSGGVGIGNNLYVTGNNSIGGISTLKTVNITSTLAATSTSTGALIVQGGTGIAGDLYVGGTIHGAGGGAFDPASIINLTNTADSTDSVTGALTTEGGLGISKTANFGGIVNVLNTTSSTSTTTGALLVEGGTAIKENLYIGGNLFVNGTTNFSSRNINTTNWLLINVLTTSQNINVIARNSANNMTQLVINANEFSTNLENFSLSNMPRFLVYDDLNGSLLVFLKSSVADTDVKALLNDVELSYIDYGSSTYPTGYSDDYVFDTSTNAGFSSSDVFYLYNTAEALSSSTGSLIVQGGIGCGGVYTGSAGVYTSNGTGGYSQIYTDSSGNMNLSSSNSGLIITSSNLQMKYQRIDDLNVNRLSNAPIYCYGAISSLKKLGCVEGLWINPTIYGTTSNSNTCYGGLTVNQGTQQMELSNLNGGLNIRNVPNYTFFLSGNQYTSADYTNNNISISSAVSASGSLSIDDGYILMNTNGSTTTTLKYPTGSAVDNGQTGSMSCYFITNENYSLPPTNTVLIMQLFGSSASGANKIQLYHFTSGFLKLQCLDQNGTQICDANLGEFMPVVGTPYFISVDWDFTNGNTQVFVNGTQIGATITTTGTRTFSINLISSCPSTASYKWGFVQIYPTKQYTLLYTPPVKTNYNLVKIPSTGGIQIYSDVSNTTSGTITCANDGSLYWNGSALPGQFIPTQVIQITNTVDSTSGSSGALQVSGGLGIAKKLSVEDTINAISTSDSTSTTTGSIVVVGGVGVAKNLSVGGALVLHNAESGSVNLSNDGGGNIIASSGTGTKIQTVFSYNWYAELNLSFNANYSSSASSLTATTSGDVSIDDGKLTIGTSTAACYWSAVGVDTGTTGCFNIKFTPNYTAPSSTITILQYVNSNGNANKLQLYQLSSGSIKFQMYDPSQASITDISFGIWTPTAGTEYELEINFTNGATRLFIDGTQFGNTNTANWSARTGTCTRINTTNGTFGGSGYKLRQIQIYNTVQHTSNYTIGITPGNIATFNNTGLSISRNLTVGGLITGTFVTTTTQSTSVSTGALRVGGGLGISKNLYVGGVVNFENTTQSTSSTTGALIVSGGAGISKNVYIGGDLTVLGSITSGIVTEFNSPVTIFTGEGGSINASFKFIQNGENCTMIVGAITGVTIFSDAPIYAGAIIPVNMRPAAYIYIPCCVINNNSICLGMCNLRANGYIYWYVGNGGNFSADTTCGWNRLVINWIN